MKSRNSRGFDRPPATTSISVALVIIGASALNGILDPATLSAADFIRGDANGDGGVTFADVHCLVARLFRDRALDCDDAGDWDDNGRLELADAIGISESVLGEDTHAPVEPYAEPGPDPTSDALGCSSSGGGSVLVDEFALLELASSPAGDGAADAELFIEVASRRPLAGFHIRLRDDGRILEHINLPWKSQRVIAHDYLVLSSDLEDGVWEIGYMMHYEDDESTFIPAFSSHTKILQFDVCVKAGVIPGDYPLSLEFAEFVDYETGQAIHPGRFVSEGLRVYDEVLESGSCERHGPEPDEPSDEPEPSDPCPRDGPRGAELAVDPVDVDVEYRLDSATAFPGEAASLTFSVNSSLAVQGLAFSINFDERDLSVVSVDEIYSRPDGGSFAFQQFEFNNDSVIAGDGIDEGNVVGATVFSFYCDIFDMPPGVDVPYARLNFLVKPGAEQGSTEVRFENGARGTGMPITNSVTVAGTTVFPEFASSFVFVDGVLNIVPGVTPFNFIRGDSNDDGMVDISDPLRTLGALFLGDGAFACADAADANDDGWIDMSDPISTLGSLFLNTGSLPFPGAESCGNDPTRDGLGCVFSRSCGSNR